MSKKTTKKKTTKQGRGRPSKFSKAMADSICDWIADGKSLRTFCEVETNPHTTTILRWLRENDDFRIQYAIARDDQTDSFVNDMVHIADNEAVMPLLDDTGNVVMVGGKPLMTTTNVSIQHAKLRIETRQWTAMKLRPKKYGTQPEGNQATAGGVIEVPGISSVEDWEKAGQEAMTRITEAHKDV